jgi:hypothetical protein
VRRGDREYLENFIEPGERLYVIGTALSELNATKDYVIKKGFEEPTFIISNQSETELFKTLKSRLTATHTFGIIAIIMCYNLYFCVTNTTSWVAS